MTKTLVLVHGAFHGPWCWQPLMERLEKQAVRCVAVDLNRGGLEADRQALQAEVDRLIDEGCRVSVIGHSLGCSPTALLDPATIDSVIFLAGPVAGASMPDVTGRISPAITQSLERRRPDGRAMISLERARDVFYHRCPADVAESAIANLRPTFVYGAKPAARPIWESIPATYIECTDDRTVFPDFQRACAELLPFSASIDTDHSPMLSEPDALAEIMLEAMARGD